MRDVLTNGSNSRATDPRTASGPHQLDDTFIVLGRIPPLSSSHHQLIAG